MFFLIYFDIDVKSVLIILENYCLYFKLFIIELLFMDLIYNGSILNLDS